MELELSIYGDKGEERQGSTRTPCVWGDKGAQGIQGTHGILILISKDRDNKQVLGHRDLEANNNLQIASNDLVVQLSHGDIVDMRVLWCIFIFIDTCNHIGVLCIVYNFHCSAVSNTDQSTTYMYIYINGQTKHWGEDAGFWTWKLADSFKYPGAATINWWHCWYVRFVEMELPLWWQA